MDSHISSFQISTFIARLSPSETPDYTEAFFVVKHTSKNSETFFFRVISIPEGQVSILYTRPRCVKWHTEFVFNLETFLLKDKYRINSHVSLGFYLPLSDRFNFCDLTEMK